MGILSSESEVVSSGRFARRLANFSSDDPGSALQFRRLKREKSKSCITAHISTTRMSYIVQGAALFGSYSYKFRFSEI